MRVLQHLVLFTLAKYTKEDVIALQTQAQIMAKKCPGIISASFAAAETTLYEDYADRTQGNNFSLIVIFYDAKAASVYATHDEHTVFKKLAKPLMASPVIVVDSFQDNFPEFALYGHTMMSPPGVADPTPGGFIGK